MSTRHVLTASRCFFSDGLVSNTQNFYDKMEVLANSCSSTTRRRRVRNISLLKLPKCTGIRFQWDRFRSRLHCASSGKTNSEIFDVQPVRLAWAANEVDEVEFKTVYDENEMCYVVGFGVELEQFLN